MNLYATFVHRRILRGPSGGEQSASEGTQAIGVFRCASGELARGNENEEGAQGEEAAALRARGVTRVLPREDELLQAGVRHVDCAAADQQEGQLHLPGHRLLDPGLFVPCCSVDVRVGPAYATPCRPCRGAADGDVAGDDECASAPHAGHSADGPQGPHSGSVEGLAHGERVLHPSDSNTDTPSGGVLGSGGLRLAPTVREHDLRPVRRCRGDALPQGSESAGAWRVIGARGELPRDGAAGRSPTAGDGLQLDCVLSLLDGSGRWGKRRRRK